MEIKINGCPCPVYVDKEMDDLINSSTVEMKKIGMFKKLRLIG